MEFHVLWVCGAFKLPKTFFILKEFGSLSPFLTSLRQTDKQTERRNRQLGGTTTKGTDRWADRKTV